MIYDAGNIFAKILRGEVPCKKVYENEFVFAFHDVAPEAPVHVLIVPKGEYVSFDDFSAQASPDELHGFFAAIGKVAELLGVAESGYRLVTNHGPDASQSVFHFHVHLLAGKPLGKLLPA